MTKRLYLLRHARPDFPAGKRLCLGSRTDLGLGSTGVEQAKALIPCFQDLLPGKPFVYASELSRARQTMEIVTDGGCRVQTIYGIGEMDGGEWDGLSFDVIRERYPEIYAIRQQDLSYPPPGGELFEHAADRMEQALVRLMESGERKPTEEGKQTGAGKQDLEMEEAARPFEIVTAHSGVNRALLCRILGRPFRENRELPQDYGCYNILDYDTERRAWEVRVIGRLPDDVPSDTEIRQLWEKNQTPEPVREHCMAVAKIVWEILEGAANLNPSGDSSGLAARHRVLRAAALLHDMCRTKHQHPAAAAEQLREQGWLKLAYIIETHHGVEPQELADPDSDKTTLTDREILFLADKYCQGSRSVSIQERYEESYLRCDSDEGRRRNRLRLACAGELEERYLRLCKAERQS